VSEGQVKRYRVKLEYDGSEFVGWQIQPEGLTVQSVLEEALERLYLKPVRVTASGRTDSGVHAAGQIVHFDTADRFSSVELQRALNHFLPEDVRVLEARSVSDDFHARFDARWRWYRYRIFQHERAIERKYGWHPRFQFDPGILKRCAAELAGEHDFTPFVRKDPELDHYRCSVYSDHWLQSGDEWQFHIVANRFLRHMVRSLVGTMLDVARGRFSVDEFIELLHSQSEEQSLYTAPAAGLCLMCVGYGDFPLTDTDNKKTQSFPFKVDIN